MLRGDATKLRTTKTVIQDKIKYFDKKKEWISLIRRGKHTEAVTKIATPNKVSWWLHHNTSYHTVVTQSSHMTVENDTRRYCAAGNCHDFALLNNITRVSSKNVFSGLFTWFSSYGEGRLDQLSSLWKYIFFLTVFFLPFFKELSEEK
jgi:hypothetical protein